MQEREHFIIVFGAKGRPRLERVIYDASKNQYTHHPIPRDGEVADRAMRSHAWKALKTLQEVQGVA